MNKRQKLTGFTDPEWCENWEEHTPAPSGFLQWHDWAEEKTEKGFMQIKCKGCGKYKIWVKTNVPED